MNDSKEETEPQTVTDLINSLDASLPLATLQETYRRNRSVELDTVDADWIAKVRLFKRLGMPADQAESILGPALQQFLPLSITGVTPGRTVRCRDRRCVVLEVQGRKVKCCRREDGRKSFVTDLTILAPDEDGLLVIGPFALAATGAAAAATAARLVERGMVPLPNGRVKVLDYEVSDVSLLVERPVRSTTHFARLIASLDGRNNLAQNEGKSLLWESSGEGFITPYETSPAIRRRVSMARGSLLFVPPSAVRPMLATLLKKRPMTTAILTKHDYLWQDYKSVEELEGSPIARLVVDGVDGELVRRAASLSYEYVVVVVPRELTAEMAQRLLSLFKITGFEVVSPELVPTVLEEVLVYRREVPPLLAVRHQAIPATPEEQRIKTVTQLNRIKEDVRSRFEKEYKEDKRAPKRVPLCKNQLPTFSGTVYNLEEDCAICQARQRGAPAITPCGHAFHWACICRSLLAKKECPIDRKPCGLSELLQLVDEEKPTAKEVWLAENAKDDSVVLASVKLAAAATTCMTLKQAETTRRVNRFSTIYVYEGYEKWVSDKAVHNLLRHTSAHHVELIYLYFDPSCEKLNLFPLYGLLP